MNTFDNVNITDFEKSVQSILQCQENIINIESKSAEFRSELIHTLIDAVNAVERSFSC